MINPSESTPADNTRRRTAARSRTGSDSSVESGPLDATLVRHPDPVRNFRTGASNPLTIASFSSVKRTTGSGPTRSLDDRFVNVGASRFQVASNPDNVLAAMLQSVNHLSTTTGAFADQIKAQSVMFAAQSGSLSDRVEAQSVAFAAVLDRLNRLERERENRDANFIPHGFPTFRQSPPSIDRTQCTEHSRSRAESRAKLSNLPRISKPTERPEARQFSQPLRSASPEMSSEVRPFFQFVPVQPLASAAGFELEFREPGRYRFGVGRSLDAAESVISPAVHGGLGPQDPLVRVRLRTLPNPLQSTPRSLGLLYNRMARKRRSRKSAKVPYC